jgi:hypothetical protein
MKTLGIIGLMAGTLLLHESSAALAAGATFTPANCQLTSGAVGYGNGQLGNSSTTTGAVLWCPVNYDTSDPVTSVTFRGYSNGNANCSTGFPGIVAFSCVVPAAGGTWNCNSGYPVSGSSPDCTAGVKSFSVAFPSHTTSDSLVTIVQLGVEVSGSLDTLIGYQSAP